MVKKANRKAIREKKHSRIRNRISGTAQYKHIYAQIIDDDAQTTLVAAGTIEKEIQDAVEHTDDIAAAEKVGEVIAQRAAEKGIKEVVFDRGGYIYMGKVAALAEAARKAGLEF